MFLRSIVSRGHVRSLLASQNYLSKSQPSNKIFTPAALGIPAFLESRKRIEDQFSDARENLFARVKESADDETGARLVFTEDLKNVVNIAKSPEELELIEKLIRKYNNQNKDLRFGTFIFGPVVMRLLYHLNEPHLALKLIVDPELKDFFAQLKSYLVAMNILSKNEMYQEVLDLFKVMQSSQVATFNNPTDCVHEVLYAARKINTHQALETGKEILSRCRQSASNVPFKAVCQLAWLAIEQNQPEVALELVSASFRPSALNPSFQILAMLKLDRPEDAIRTLKGVASNSGQKIYEEPIIKLGQYLEKNNNAELKGQLEQLTGDLKRNDSILTLESVEGFLDRKLEPRIRNDLGGQNLGQANYQRRGMNMPPRSGYNSYDQRQQLGERRPRFQYDDRRSNNQRRGLTDDDEIKSSRVRFPQE